MVFEILNCFVGNLHFATSEDEQFGKQNRDDTRQRSHLYMQHTHTHARPPPTTAQGMAQGSPQRMSTAPPWHRHRPQVNQSASAFVNPLPVFGSWRDNALPLSGLYGTLRKDNAQLWILLNQQLAPWP